MPDQLSDRQLLTTMPQIGERWEFTANTLTGDITCEGEVTGHIIHVGLCVMITLDTSDGPRTLNITGPVMVHMRRLPHLVLVKPEPYIVPEATEGEDA